MWWRNAADQYSGTILQLEEVKWSGSAALPTHSYWQWLAASKIILIGGIWVPRSLKVEKTLQGKVLLDFQELHVFEISSVSGEKWSTWLKQWREKPNPPSFTCFICLETCECVALGDVQKGLKYLPEERHQVFVPLVNLILLQLLDLSCWVTGLTANTQSMKNYNFHNSSDFVFPIFLRWTMTFGFCFTFLLRSWLFLTVAPVQTLFKMWNPHRCTVAASHPSC